jgi:hypothetical protein
MRPGDVLAGDSFDGLASGRLPVVVDTSLGGWYLLIIQHVWFPFWAR